MISSDTNSFSQKLIWMLSHFFNNIMDPSVNT